MKEEQAFYANKCRKEETVLWDVSKKLMEENKMKKRNSKIKTLVMSVGIFAMFITIVLSTAIGIQINEQNNYDTTQEIAPLAEPSLNEQITTDGTPVTIALENPLVAGPRGWNFWSNPPHMYNMNSGNIGIGTETPAAKLDIYGDLAINGVVIIDASGEWIGPVIPCLWGLNGNDLYYINGNVGIGTTSPLAKLQVNNGAVLFNGTTGGTPTSGSGTRLMWIPSNAAFRAGYTYGNRWDNINIGNFSFAVGYGSKANGTASTAMGTNTIASGYSSTALGQGTLASGIGSIALCTGTTASGDHSFASGYGTTASGYMSTAMGSDTTANGFFSTAMGKSIYVNGENSIGIGLDFQYPQYQVNQNNVMSIMGGNVGIGTTAPIYPLDVEGDIRASGNMVAFEDMTAGTNIFAYEDVWAGENVTAEKYLISHGGIISTEDVNFYAPLTVWDDVLIGGNVGIGTSSPQEKLHVAGDYLRVDGAGNEAAYIGGDGWGADVQIGSFRSDINAVSFWNMATGTFMGGAMSELCIKGGSDIAEPFDVKENDEVKPGMVLSIDAENPGQLKVSEKAYDRCVAGIISGAGDIKPGVILGQEGSLAYGKYPVALAGRVYGLCDASYGSIQPGDLLTTSPTPGYAMKVTDYATAQGAILGKAMTGLEVGTGLVLILVSLQ